MISVAHQFHSLLCSPIQVIACSLYLFPSNCLSVPHLSLRCSLQDSELKRTVDESERIKRAYGHYFDLCIVNDGLEAAFRSLRLALEKLSTEQQWVPVSWVFWKSPRAHQQGARGHMSEVRGRCGSSGRGCLHAVTGGGGVWWRAERRDSVQMTSLM